MASIYELGQGFRLLANMIEDGTVDDEVITDAWENQTEALADKGENVAKYMKIVDGEIAVIDEEIKRLQALKKSKQNGKERIKTLMQDAMNAAGEKKLKCGTFTVSIQSNPPSCVIDCDLAGIPSKYLIPQEPKVDKKAMLEDLKNEDNILAGIAHIEQGESLRIR